MGNAGNHDPSDIRVGAIGSSQSSTPSEATAEVEALESAQESASASATTAIDPSAGPQQTQGSQAVAAALGAGTIDSAQAKAQLIDQALRSQLPPGADPATVAALRAQVEALLANDPVLEDLLRT